MSVKKRKYPFNIGAVFFILYAFFSIVLRLYNRFYSNGLWYNDGFYEFNGIEDVFRVRLFDSFAEFVSDLFALFFVFIILVSAIFMLAKLPQASSIGIFLASVTPLYWVITDIFSNDLYLWSLLFLFSDVLFYLTFIVLAVIGLDTFPIFKRPTVSLAWIVPPILSLISTSIFVGYDLFYFISKILDGWFYAKTILHNTINFFDDFVLLLAFFFTALWFFRCKRLRWKEYREGLKEQETIVIPNDLQEEINEIPVDETTVSDFVKPEEVTVVEEIGTSSPEEESSHANVCDLFKLKEMLDSGLITRDEFDIMKESVIKKEK